jgi:hypothetical protein
MGCYNETCACTHLPIYEGDTCVVFICKEKDTYMPDSPLYFLQSITHSEIGIYDGYGCTEGTKYKYPGNVYTTDRYLKVFLGKEILKHFDIIPYADLQADVSKHYQLCSMLSRFATPEEKLLDAPKIMEEHAVLAFHAWRFCAATRTNIFGTTGTGSQQGIRPEYTILANLLLAAGHGE